MARKKIAIIGAGISGILAIKSCQDEGLEPVCFEKSDHIAGLWKYDKDVKVGQGSVMKCTVTNASKEVNAFSDFPVPDDFPNYLHHSKVYEYYNLYAEKFDLKRHIRYMKEITRVEEEQDFETSGKWKVCVKDVLSGEISSDVFDGVMVCTGHHASPRIPSFPGSDEFQGKQIHSHQYRSSKDMEDKTVVVVGVGNSGCDVACELGTASKQVYLSSRRGVWMVTRMNRQGLPTDMDFHVRAEVMLHSKLLPAKLSNYIWEKKLNEGFDHKKIGLQPKHTFASQNPFMNDELHLRLASGRVLLKPNIEKLNGKCVTFTDGSTVDDVDVIVYATGYHFGFPFMKNILKVDDNKVDLYKYVFPPDLKHQTLAMVGCVQPTGPNLPICELQCRWITRVFKGLYTLPSKEAMWNDIHSTRAAMKERFISSPSHTIQVDWIPYMDDIAQMIGCKPNIGKLLLTDPVLAWQCFFGCCIPAQWRLVGPLTWPGARQTIMDTDRRVHKPFQNSIDTCPAREHNTFALCWSIIAFLAIAAMIKCALI